MALIASIATTAFAGLMLYLIGGTVVFSAVISLFSNWTVALLAVAAFTVLYITRR